MFDIRYKNVLALGHVGLTIAASYSRSAGDVPLVFGAAWETGGMQYGRAEVQVSDLREGDGWREDISMDGWREVDEGKEVDEWKEVDGWKRRK